MFFTKITHNKSVFKRDEVVSEYLVPFFHIDDSLHPLQLRLLFFLVNQYNVLCHNVLIESPVVLVCREAQYGDHRLAYSELT